MNRGILEHVWKSYVIVAVLFIYSNAAFAFDDIESVRHKMSKGDIITNTDSIDFLFGIDRSKQVYNPYQDINCIFYDTVRYGEGAELLITKDSLENIVVPSSIEIYGKTYIVRRFDIGNPSFNINDPTHVYTTSQGYENVKLKSIVIPSTVRTVSGLINMLYLETAQFEKSPNGLFYGIIGGFFTNCPNLKMVTLPEGLEFLPNKSFSGCSSLKEIVLPQSLEIINENCFSGCTQLEKIYIPANVDEIDSSAFENCPNLKEIIIDSNNPYYDSRDNCNAIIDSETNTLIRACSTSTIPEGVQIIATHAFQNCDIQSVTIPESVTTICDFAFENSSIQELNIPASVDSIGMAICAGCRSLEKITVDKKNKKYDSRKGCNAIIRTADNTLITASNNAYIPNGVEVIGIGAFICSGITNIYIPQSVKKVEMQAFAGCISLDKITVDKRNKVYYSENNCLIKDKTLVAGCSKSVIPSDITTIGAFAFRYIPLYWKLDIPDNITEIQSHAFSECNTIECLTLPDSLTLLGDYAFADCNNLTSVVINSVDKFGEGAFYACRKLHNVSFLSPIDSLGDLAFYNCLNLESIVLPNGMTYIGEYAFYRCLNLEYVGFPTTLEEISRSSFESCKSLNIVCLPNNLKYMHIGNFCGCSNLIEMDFPDSLHYYHDLYNCRNLETIKLPFLNFQKGEYTNTFSDCTNLKKVILK